MDNTIEDQGTATTGDQTSHTTLVQDFKHGAAGHQYGPTCWCAPFPDPTAMEAGTLLWVHHPAPSDTDRATFPEPPHPDSDGLPQAVASSVVAQLSEPDDQNTQTLGAGPTSGIKVTMTAAPGTTAEPSTTGPVVGWSNEPLIPDQG